MSPWSRASSLTQNATWVDLKGKDAVPETVHHTMVTVDPATEPGGWAELKPQAPTDNLHALDDLGGGGGKSKEAESEVGRDLVDWACSRSIDEAARDRLKHSFHYFENE